VVGEQQGSLYTISAAGGAATEAGGLNSPPFATYALAWSPDEQQVAYNIGQNRNATDNGVWLADANGQNARQLVAAATLQEVASAVEFSADGRYVLSYRLAGEFPADWSRTYSRVVPVAGGAAAQADLDNRGQWPTWAPAGAGLAYILRLPEAPEKEGLYLAAGPREEGKQVYQGTFSGPTGQYQTLIWAGNNTILVLRQPDLKFVLLHLGMPAASP
jgi:hypothetical protein